MRAIEIIEPIDHDRRRLLKTAAISVAAAGVASLFPVYLAAAADGEPIRPFRIHVPEERLAHLRRRIAATSYASFSDPDGNKWLLQEITEPLPGRVDAEDTAFISPAELAAALRRLKIHGFAFPHRRMTSSLDAEEVTL